MNTMTAQIPETVIIPFPGTKKLTDRMIDNRLRKLAELEADQKRIKKEIDAVKQEIIEQIGDGAGLETNNFVVKYTRFTQNSVDSKKLKEVFPDIYAQVLRVINKTKFTYSKV